MYQQKEDLKWCKNISIQTIEMENMYKTSSTPCETAAVDNTVFFLLLRKESSTT